MTAPKTVSVQIPFSGFYESIWSQAIDQEQESYCEYQEQENWPSFPDIAALPKQFQPSTDWPGLQEILFDNSRHCVAYNRLAQDYTECFWQTISDELGQPITAYWDGMSSPREYNFTTDRIFSNVPLKVMRAMLNALTADADSRAILDSMIALNHTSRDGFISFYSIDPAAWLAKPLRDWDHNELGTLLDAYIDLTGISEDSDSIDWLIYEAGNMHEAAYSAWESCVDWPAVEAELQAVANDAMAEAGLIDPLSLPYRCPLTLELPLESFMVPAGGLT